LLHTISVPSNELSSTTTISALIFMKVKYSHKGIVSPPSSL
jgi:hypothetical protein